MAMRIINFLMMNDLPVQDGAHIISGDVVALTADDSDGSAALTRADRSVHESRSLVGLASDDSHPSGDIILVDPVSITVSAKPIRRLGDYLGEDIAPKPRKRIQVVSSGEMMIDRVTTDHVASFLTLDEVRSTSLENGDRLTYGS